MVCGDAAGYAKAVTQDTPSAAPGSQAYTPAEAQALELAAELRDRVQRERTVVHRLQEYLSGRRRLPPYPLA
jgi:hypothetical protein